MPKDDHPEFSQSEIEEAADLLDRYIQVCMVNEDKKWSQKRLSEFDAYLEQVVDHAKQNMGISQ